MLKSLEKLRGGINIAINASPDEITHEALRKLADEIQAEIDRFYLPRPLFEDGVPADFGDDFLFVHDSRKIDSITYSLSLSGDGYFIEISDKDCCTRALFSGDRLKRPPEPDTQEKIDADITLAPKDYCENYGLDTTNGQRIEAKTRHLLARQRKLDGVE